jgi:serine/threonine protein kinase
MTDRIVEFVRERDLILKKELGHGACGRTVLLYDDIIDEYFVCKKYAPVQEKRREDLFQNFVREIKLLHLLNHVNIVRVFNYFIYPDRYSGYILMEYIKGTDIEDYLAKHPEDINEIFAQIVEGFAHLEKNDILHRDIRPFNILVNNEGLVEIIDFGFGKKIVAPKDFGKSISLNWWCEPPSEFSEQIYNYTTEVYFVGKLLEKIVAEGSIEQFKYASLLGRMCARAPSARIPSFSQVRKERLTDKFFDIGFDDNELRSYRAFSESLSNAILKIEQKAKYFDDIEEIQRGLEDAYKKVMLEEYVPANPLIIRWFVNGAYYYSKTTIIPVSCVKSFLDLIRSSSREKKNIIVSNIQTKLDAINRYDEEMEIDDIPF